MGHVYFQSQTGFEEVISAVPYISGFIFHIAVFFYMMTQPNQQWLYCWLCQTFKCSQKTFFNVFWKNLKVFQLRSCINKSLSTYIAKSNDLLQLQLWSISPNITLRCCSNGITTRCYRNGLFYVILRAAGV